MTGRNRIRLEADTTVEQLVSEPFDMLILPGGPAVMEMRNNERVAELVKAFAEEGKWIAAV